jgi:serine phosphatase RsbU (regulator of sigma subunit)
LNIGRILPGRDGALRTNGRRSNTNASSIMAPITSANSRVTLQDEVDSLRREKIELHSQLFEAAEIQRKLSGPHELRHGCLQFASEIFAARFLPGDFTTFFKSDSKVLAAHGDIAGKGVAAGMWFTHLAGLLQTYGHPGSQPAKVASEINRHLCYLRPVAPFVTAFLAQIDCHLGELTYCNAGHFPPVLLRADGRTELLERGGPLLGALDGAEFISGELMLEPGDTLVAYSDGVLECCNPSGEEFGLDRLVATLRNNERLSVQNTLMVLLAAVQDFTNGSPLSDDVSLTVIQRVDSRAAKNGLGRRMRKISTPAA